MGLTIIGLGKMRLVLLINPKVPVEHGIKGRNIAEASFGFDVAMSEIDPIRIAKALREAANLLEAPTIEDPDLI